MVSKVYLVFFTFRSMDVQIVSVVYLLSFDQCIRRPHLLMFRSNLEISSVPFIYF